MPKRGGTSLFLLFATVAVTAAGVVTAVATGGAAGARTAGGLIFDGGFNSGTYTPWRPPQCSNYANPTNNSQVHFGTFTIDKTTVGQGPYSGQFTLPAWSGGRTRCEVLTPRSASVGSDDYYSLMVYLPAGWTPGTSSFWGVTIAQLNWEGLPGSPIALQAHSDHVTIAVDTGVCGTTCQYRSNADAWRPNLPPLYAIPRPMQLGVWHELVLDVHWATNSSGVVEAWHRVKGQGSWTKTASLSGYPTLAVSSSGQVPSSTFDKTGAYRAASSAPVTVVTDGFGRAGSFAAASANLP